MAGGKGTRMKVSEEKPLLKICGLPMIERVVAALKKSRKIDSIIVAVSTNTPKTTKHLLSLQVRVIKTPGDDYVSDLGYAIKSLKLQKVLTIGADFPLITANAIDDIITEYFRCGKPSLAVAVPLETKINLGLDIKYEFEHKNQKVVFAGINVLDGQRINEKELEEAIYVVECKEIAVNINTTHDLAVAEKILQSEA
jgi:adenosylcobinamide-phosphate guanylyltransferase